MTTGESIQIAVGIVLTLTLGAVLWYAWETRKMAEAVLRPVIEQWLEAPRYDVYQTSANASIELTLNYQNIGSGPAFNIRWSIDPLCGTWVNPPRWLDTPERVGMGARVERKSIRVGGPSSPSLNVVGELASRPASIRFHVDRSFLDSGALVRAYYEDVSGTKWVTTLELDVRDGKLANGRCKIERDGLFRRLAAMMGKARRAWVG